LKINKVAKFITCFNEHFELFNYPKLESLGLKALEFSFKGQALGDLLMPSFLHLKHFNQDSLNAWLTLHSKKVSGVWFKEVVSVVLKFKDHLKV
ncbi:MAG: hypothetical protein IJU40_00500, partial [Desulfovibrionaceae bacterium]|nr:hypothetical protein [Desulfovibrionaceae bacterium]